MPHFSQKRRGEKAITPSIDKMNDQNIRWRPVWEQDGVRNPFGAANPGSDKHIFTSEQIMEWLTTPDLTLDGTIGRRNLVGWSPMAIAVACGRQPESILSLSKDEYDEMVFKLSIRIAQMKGEFTGRETSRELPQPPEGEMQHFMQQQPIVPSDKSPVTYTASMRARQYINYIAGAMDASGQEVYFSFGAALPAAVTPTQIKWPGCKGVLIVAPGPQRTAIMEKGSFAPTPTNILQMTTLTPMVARGKGKGKRHEPDALQVQTVSQVQKQINPPSFSKPSTHTDKTQVKGRKIPVPEERKIQDSNLRKRLQTEQNVRQSKTQGSSAEKPPPQENPAEEEEFDGDAQIAKLLAMTSKPESSDGDITPPAEPEVFADRVRKASPRKVTSTDKGEGEARKMAPVAVSRPERGRARRYSRGRSKSKSRSRGRRNRSRDRKTRYESRRRRHDSRRHRERRHRSPSFDRDGRPSKERLPQLRRRSFDADKITDKNSVRNDEFHVGMGEKGKGAYIRREQEKAAQRREKLEEAKEVEDTPTFGNKKNQSTPKRSSSDSLPEADSQSGDERSGHESSSDAQPENEAEKAAVKAALAAVRGLNKKADHQRKRMKSPFDRTPQEEKSDNEPADFDDPKPDFSPLDVDRG